MTFLVDNLDSIIREVVESGCDIKLPHGEFIPDGRTNNMGECVYAIKFFGPVPAAIIFTPGMEVPMVLLIGEGTPEDCDPAYQWISDRVNEISPTGAFHHAHVVIRQVDKQKWLH